MRTKHLKWLGTTPVLAAVIALGASGGAAASPTAVGAATCVKQSNIEAIIDDSGSMDFTDAAKNRTQLINALNSLAGNKGKKLGAVEFGDTAGNLFPPTTIPISAATLSTAFALVNADNGTTDYNLAFTQATTANPTADARIFLSDGGHNVGTYANKHLTPNVKTYTVGFGSTDPALLTQIAADTGGLAFNLTDSSAVPAVAAGITAGLNCRPVPLVFTDLFTKQGQSKGHVFSAAGKTADILTTWSTEGTNITPTQIRNGLPAAVASAAKVKVQVKKGTTFTTVHLRGLKKKQKVKFKVKAKTLVAPTTATTQVIR